MNPNIANERKTGPTSEIGKWKARVNRFQGSKNQPPSRKVPPQLAELYNWYKGFRTKDIETLLELQNIYKVIKDGFIDRLADKILSNEQLTRKDLDHLKLIKDTLVDYHKLKYGDKKTVEHTITMKDVRKAIFSDKPKKVVEVEPDGSISQDMDRSGRSERTQQENGKNKKSDGSSGEVRNSSEHN